MNDYTQTPACVMCSLCEYTCTQTNCNAYCPCDRYPTSPRLTNWLRTGTIDKTLPYHLEVTA